MQAQHPSSDATVGHVVVVGSGLAGLRTVERLRRLGHAGAITIIGDESQPPYDRPPLSKSFLTEPETPAPLYLRPEEKWGELDVDRRLGCAATGLDREARQISLADGSYVDYDVLVVATGARARTIPAWADVPGTHVLRTHQDAVGLREALRPAGSVVVIGAGVLGCEIAASARERGVVVDLVDLEQRPMARVVPREVGEVVARQQREHGVTLHLGTGVSSLTAAPELRLELSDGSLLHPDAAVLAVGSVAATDWLADSGLTVDDGVLCDSEGRTDDPRVWIVGDVARVRTEDGSSTRREHWTAAGDSAARVAARIVGQDPPFATDVPYFWSDQYGAKIQTLGSPGPDDDVRVVAGTLDSGRFLAILSRSDTVTGAVGIGMPGPLMRCRRAVERAERLGDLLDRAPWAPRQKAPA